MPWRGTFGTGLAFHMEQYGKDNEFTRIAGFAPSAGAAGQEPAALIAHWSKRRGQIVDAAREMGFNGPGQRTAGGGDEQDHAGRQIAGQRPRDPAHAVAL